MNYHFNQGTISQLVHLVKNQSFTVSSLRLDSKTQYLYLKIVRKDEPNADEYQIIIRFVKNYSLSTPDFIKSDNVTHFFVSDKGNFLNFEGAKGALRVEVERVDVSAVGSQLGPE